MSIYSEMIQAGYKKRDDYYDDECVHCKYSSNGRNDYECYCSKFDTYVGQDDICNYFVDFYKTEEGRAWFNEMAQPFIESVTGKTNMENSNTQKNQSEGCYIATAVYGGYDEPEVRILRRYRDEVMKKSIGGRTFIKIYYALSPKVAERMKKHIYINSRVRKVLDIIVSKIDRKYYT